jgi:hypothetical protein
MSFMYLKMYIGKLLVARWEIEFTGMHTAMERQQHGEEIALDMYIKHYDKVRQSKQKPVFFIDHVQSKMNYQAITKINQ